MKHITNAIFSQAVRDLSLSEAAEATGVCRSAVAKYVNENYEMNPRAETWLKSLAKLGLVTVKNGQLIIKSDVITRDLKNALTAS